METKRYNAYNSTRGTLLNSKLGVADRDLEPLKFMELLIGGLGLDSETGLWLKPLAGAPEVPRVFPFDILYLDQNQKVIQAAEIFPGVDFPPFSKDVVSALILPLHAASSTQTAVGDELLVRSEGAVAEEPVKPVEQPVKAAEEVTAAVEETPQLATATLDPPVAAVVEIPQLATATLDPPVAAVVEIPQLATATLDPPVAAVVESPKPSKLSIFEAVLPSVESEAHETPVESVAEKPLQISEEVVQTAPASHEAVPSAETTDAEAPKKATEDPKEQKDEPTEVTAAPELQAVTPQTTKASDTPRVENPQAEKKAAAPSKENSRATSGPSRSASDSARQNATFTVAQYGKWAVSTSTIPTASVKAPKAAAPKAAPSETVVEKPAVQQVEKPAEPIIREETKPVERPPRAVQPTRLFLNSFGGRSKSAAPAPEQKQEPPTTPVAELAPKEPARNPEVNVVAEPAQPAAASPKTPNTQPSKPTVPATGDVSISPIQDPAAARRDSQMPLWRAETGPPAANTPSTSGPGHAEQPRAAGSPNRTSRPVSRSQSIVRTPLTKAWIDQTAKSASESPHLPEALTRLKTAIQRMGTKTDTHEKQKQSLLNSEALHRDRRRAVRRTVPGMVAFYFTGASPQPYTVADISATGFFLLTRDHWMPDTMIQMTLQKPALEGKQRKESITVLTRIIRRANDGIGLEFVMPEGLEHRSRDIRPDRATDRMALARFLFSEEFPDSFEVLGCFITPPVDQQTNTQATEPSN
jgi:hypothetical protein